MAFYVWLLSLGIMFLSFIHDVACITFHSFSWQNNTPLYQYFIFYSFIYQLVELWIISTFDYFVFIYTFLYEHLLSIFSYFLQLHVNIELFQNKNFNERGKKTCSAED